MGKRATSEGDSVRVKVRVDRHTDVPHNLDMASVSAALAGLLPKPRYAPEMEEEDEAVLEQQQQLLAPTGPRAPAYGRRRGWVPSSAEDFGDGGAYPEVRVAQFPLEMGRKKVSQRVELC